MDEDERISRLTALAAAMGADGSMLDAAIASGQTPDGFAVAVADRRLQDQEAEAIAQRIIAAADAPLDDEADRVAARIAAS